MVTAQPPSDREGASTGPELAPPRQLGSGIGRIPTRVAPTTAAVIDGGEEKRNEEPANENFHLGIKGKLGLLGPGKVSEAKDVNEEDILVRLRKETKSYIFTHVRNGHSNLFASAEVFSDKLRTRLGLDGGSDAMEVQNIVTLVTHPKHGNIQKMVLGNETITLKKPNRIAQGVRKVFGFDPLGPLLVEVEES